MSRILPLRPILRTLFALAAVLIASGCVSTHIASTWRDTNDAGGAMKKIAIFAATSEDAIRRLAETRAVQSLPPATTGVPGFTLFDKPEKDIDKVKVRLTAEGFDGALISRLVSHDKNETYIPPQVHIAPTYPGSGYLPYYQSFYYYYPYAYTYVTPGYVALTQRYLVETLLYRLPDGKPVWSAVSESVNPESKIVLVNEIVRVITDELRKQHLLAEK
jgi:hypothetical protein